MAIHQVFVVICAYGIWGTTNRTPKEIVGYGMYLRSCAEAIQSLLTSGFNVQAILCGGAVKDGKTEAQSVFEYLRSAVNDEGVKYHLEERSLSTAANIFEAYKIVGLAKGDFPAPNVLVCCDQAREHKVNWLVGKWSKPYPSEVVAFNRPDINPRSSRLFQYLETIALALIPRLLQKKSQQLRSI